MAIRGVRSERALYDSVRTRRYPEKAILPQTVSDDVSKKKGFVDVVMDDMASLVPGDAGAAGCSDFGRSDGPLGVVDLGLGLKSFSLPLFGPGLPFRPFGFPGLDALSSS